MTNPPAETARVTRRQIAAAVAPALQTGPRSRAELVECARTHGAPPPLCEVLEGLPDNRRFTELRQLWVHMPGVPVDAS